MKFDPMNLDPMWILLTNIFYSTDANQMGYFVGGADNLCSTGDHNHFMKIRFLLNNFLASFTCASNATDVRK